MASKVYIDKEGNLHYDKYVKMGNMMVLREALSPNNPNHLYNYLKAQNIEPELYGINHPDAERFEDMNRQQLISHILELERQLEHVSKFF